MNKLTLFNYANYCEKYGHNVTDIFIYSGSALASSLGLALSFSNYLLSSDEPEIWILLIERLGVPVVMMALLVISLYKIIQAVIPFMLEQLAKLTSLPREQLESERQARADLLKLMTDTNEKYIKSIDGLSDKIDTLITAIVKKEEK